MPEIYPYISENQSSQGIEGLVIYASSVTNNLLFPFILLALWIIIFVSSIGMGGGRSFVYACFFCSIIAIFMVVGNVLSPVYMYLLFVMLGAGMIMLRLSRSSALPQI